MTFEYFSRNILLDPFVHSQLKENHEENPYYRQYAGSWYQSQGASRANIYHEAYQANLILELCLAGRKTDWLSTLIRGWRLEGSDRLRLDHLISVRSKLSIKL